MIVLVLLTLVYYILILHCLLRSKGDRCTYGLIYARRYSGTLCCTVMHNVERDRICQSYVTFAISLRANPTLPEDDRREHDLLPYSQVPLLLCCSVFLQ